VWTNERLAATGLLFATSSIAEAALLRCLGLAATLCPRFFTPALAELRALDECFSGRDFPGHAKAETTPEAQPDAAATGSGPAGNQQDAAPAAPKSGPVPTPPSEPPAARGTLVLPAWSLLSVTACPGPFIRRTARLLAEARRHLDLAYPGVVVWKPGEGALDHLRYRLRLRDMAAVREWFRTGADEVDDVEVFAADAETSMESAPLDLAATRAALLAALAADTGRGQRSARARAARASYDAAVEGCVVEPLEAWALDDRHPLIAAAGVEAADVLRLVYRMGPSMQELLRCALDSLPAGGAEPMPLGVLDQYLAINRQAGSLLGMMARMRMRL